MSASLFSLQRLELRIDEAAPAVQLAVEERFEVKYDLEIVKEGLRRRIFLKLETLEDEIGELYTDPQRDEFAELARELKSLKMPVVAAVVSAKQEVERPSLKLIGLLKDSRLPDAVVEPAKQKVEQLALPFGQESIYGGHKGLSQRKLAAMIEYICSRGHYIYKTNLNKLLWYADMSYFYLRKEGMSGAVYEHRPFGPVSDSAKPTVDDMLVRGNLTKDPLLKTFKANKKTRLSSRYLNKKDKKLLDWVLETYGSLEAGVISELSHDEIAYKNTEANERISYGYAVLLKHLPPADLLD